MHAGDSWPSTSPKLMLSWLPPPPVPVWTCWTHLRCSGQRGASAQRPLSCCPRTRVATGLGCCLELLPRRLLGRAGACPLPFSARPKALPYPLVAARNPARRDSSVAFLPKVGPGRECCALRPDELHRALDVHRPDLLPAGKVSFGTGGGQTGIDVMAAEFLLLALDFFGVVRA